MLIVRDTFIAKPGMASKLARLMRDVMKDLPDVRARVLTDLVSDFNKVVLEAEATDLADFERRFKKHMEDPEFVKKRAGYTDMYVTGRREIFRVVD